MALTFDTLSDLLALGHDEIIDVRSPAEFAEDHLPGAINLPVLDNDERARVGTIYVQDSPFKARKLGAALVFRNAATHIEQRLSHHEGGWRPLVYCWRGGQRSGSFAWMLQQIGWRADVVQGGYQTYRRLVHRMLYEDPLPHQILLLEGGTGSAKTAILQTVARLGGQVLDLEAMANHRGSLLGACDGGQPSQKAFESSIACALARFDPTRPVLIEAEASKIGARILPPMLRNAMFAAPCVDIIAPIEARVAFLQESYSDILADHSRLREKLSQLRAHRSGAVVDHWMALIDADDRAALTRSLVLDHYDPAYDKARARQGCLTLGTVAAGALDAAGIRRAAEAVLAQMQAFSAG